MIKVPATHAHFFCFFAKEFYFDTNQRKIRAGHGACMQAGLVGWLVAIVRGRLGWLVGGHRSCVGAWLAGRDLRTNQPIACQDSPRLPGSQPDDSC